MSQTVTFEVDSRSGSMSFPMPSGLMLRVNQDSLRALMETWPRTEETPPGPAGLLKVAREIVLTSMAFYEQLGLLHG
jgi:hypothetical protein